MCFSASASFGSAAVLSGFGLAALKNRSARSQTLFAVIPLAFALQQCIEGIVWLTIPAAPRFAALQAVAAYLFLVMAQVLWPLLMPLALIPMEENPKRKKYLRGFLALGAVVVLYYAYGIAFGDLAVSAEHYHIQYQTFSTGAPTIIFFALYTLATITPLFISSVRGTYKMGLLMFGSCLVSLFFFVHFLTSVWCFFAAAISFFVYTILKGLRVQAAGLPPSGQGR